MALNEPSVVKVTCTHSKIIKTTLKIKQFLCIKFCNGTPNNHVETLFLFKLNWKILSLAFNKVLLLVMFKGSPQNYTSITGDDVTLRLVFLIPGSCTMNTNLKVYWEPSRYSNIAEPKPFWLSNYYSIINTQGRWLPNAHQVGCYGQWQHISVLNYSSL